MNKFEIHKNSINSFVVKELIKGKYQIVKFFNDLNDAHDYVQRCLMMDR